MAEEVAGALEKSRLPIDLILASRDGTAIAAEAEWNSRVYRRIRQSNSPPQRIDSDSHTCARAGDEEALADAGLEAPRRGENVHLDLELCDFEAREGTRRLVRYPVAVRCRACMGHGSVHVPDPESDLLDPCPRCDGRGVVQTEEQVRLRISADLQDEAQLRVRGEGNDAGAGSVPGDLLVHIHILPTPRDRPVIRYVAFGLLVLAVLTLIVYLVR